MNPTTEPVKESVYDLRRLGESFSQFRTDLWESVPIPLLVLAAAAVVARVWYGAYHRRAHPHAKPDAAVYWLGWGAALSVLALVGWTLVAFYKADADQTRTGASSLSSLGEDNATRWWVFVGGVFALGSAFVVWMYVRDARSVRWFWAAKLALVRIAVYALLCFVFLLPARETWERTEKRSRVVVLIDISPSMTKISDDVARKGSKQKTRMETLVELLTDQDVALIANILKTNPVAVYPFGTRLDETPRVIPNAPGAAAWGPDEWRSVAAYDFRPFLLQGLSDDGQNKLRMTTQPVAWSGPKPPAGAATPEPADWAAWVKLWTDRKAEPVLAAGLSDADTKVLRENLERLERRVDVARAIATGTNVPDSVADAINRESPNMVQGVIVFSDLRSNAESDAQYRDLKAAADRASVPVFTVAVGLERKNTEIAITDIQVDDVLSPQEGGKVSVGADGGNLAGKTVNVELDVFLPGLDPKDPNTKPSYTFKDSREDKTKGTPTPYALTFADGDPPHGTVEFVIKPDQLAADPDPMARGLVAESDKGAFTKMVLREGTWAFRARIARDENETFADEFHTRDRGGVQVIPKKVRVLAIASAPSREFHFFRTFMNREVVENRATFAILLQNEAGRGGNFTPNAGEKLLLRWPLKLDVSSRPDPKAEVKVDPKDDGKIDPNVDPRPYNLNEYDVIVAFDPDWNGADLNDPNVSKQQADDLQAWVERQGGGLILVADRINTYQLARVEQGSRLSPVLEVLPVVPDDIVAVKIRSIPKHFRRLYLSPMPGSDLLKIDDPPPSEEKKDEKEKPDDPVAGWEKFFTGRERYEPNRDDKVELFPKYGFYSAYPLKENRVKAGAKTLAEFADVDEQGQKLLRPWLVVSNPAAGFRTAYLASGELFRFHQYDPVVGKDFYDRFWAKFLRYMAAKRNVKAARGRVLTTKEVQSGDPIRVTAQLLDTASKPYPAGGVDAKFSVVRTAPDGMVLAREGPFELAPSGVDGYFKGQVTADPRRFPVGDYVYTVEVEVPDSPGEKLSTGFAVTRVDREMKDAVPNFAAGVRMASAFTPGFQERVPAAAAAALAAGLPKEAGVPKLAFRLADRHLIKYIPDCFKTVPSRSDIRGPVEDLWDEKIELFNVWGPDPSKEGATDWAARLERWGFRRLGDTERAATPAGEFFTRGPRMFRTGPEGQPSRPEAGADGKPPVQVAVSWVLLAVVLLLGWEWLTRKLLRLA
ncbi:MAG: hypothetical protein C0501_11450 [Isosphaera sp.]|nr:hypothetical protein [Isosphaera sp.]